jgi:hypothetical protein
MVFLARVWLGRTHGLPRLLPIVSPEIRGLISGDQLSARGGEQVSINHAKWMIDG